MMDFSVFTSSDAWSSRMQTVLNKHIECVPEFFTKVSKLICNSATIEFISRLMFYMASIIDEQDDFWKDEGSMGCSVVIFAACLLSKFKNVRVTELPYMLIIAMIIAHKHLDDISVGISEYARKTSSDHTRLQFLVRAFLELIDWRSHVTMEEFNIFKNSM